MNWNIEFIEERNYLIVVIEGDFNATDHLLMIEDVISHKNWKSGMNVLLDSRKVDYSQASLEVMRQASNNMSRFDSSIGKGRAAILMGTTINFGKGRQFEMLSEGKIPANIRTFRDEDKALEWVNGD